MKYQPIPSNGGGTLTSIELNMRLLADGVVLRQFNIETGDPILTRVERIEQEKRKAEEARRQAQHAKDRSEAELQLIEEGKSQTEKRALGSI